jgi:membrane associated rhomboid family serine protease/Zn-finger nucleic acid-binding protein
MLDVACSMFIVRRIMPDCPKCRTALARRKNEFGVFWYCQQCDGSAVTMSLLRKFVATEALNGLWQRVRLGSYPRKHPCPGCRRRMEQVTVDAEGKTRAIDVCSTCQFVWLDEGEWADLAFFAAERSPQEDVAAQVRAQIAAKRQDRQDDRQERVVSPPQPRKEPVEPQLQPPEGAIVAEPTVDIYQPREQIAKPRRAPRTTVNNAPHTRIESRQPRRAERKHPKPSESRPERINRHAESGWGKGPTEFWQWIPALLGLPVEEEQPDGRLDVDSKPWFTWMLAIGITLVSLLAMFDLRNVTDAYGLIPAEWDRLDGLTWLTAFFLHGGLLHLIGNVYFLLIFGDNVEKCLGTLEFFLLLVMATLAGHFLHIAFDPDSTVPCIGASGGISGVIAFYALRFPKNQMAVMFWFLFKTYWWRMSALWLFGIWVMLQFIIAGQQMVGISHVSGAAHLGGALVGFVAWLLWRINGGGRDELSRNYGKDQRYVR